MIKSKLMAMHYRISSSVVLVANVKAMFSANLKNENYGIRTKEN